MRGAIFNHLYKCKHLILFTPTNRAALSNPRPFEDFFFKVKKRHFCVGVEELWVGWNFSYIIDNCGSAVMLAFSSN